MNKLGTAIGGLLLIGALAAPVAFAHYDSGAHPGPLTNHPTAAANFDRPSGWYYTSTGLDLDVDGAPIPNPANPDDCEADNEDTPVDENAICVFLSSDVSPDILDSFGFFGLYDVEVGGQGACFAPGVGTTQQQAVRAALTATAVLNEKYVDGATGDGVLATGTVPALVPDGVHNDGGNSMVGHTFGHYDCNGTPGVDTSNWETGECNDYDQAFAYDLVSGGDIWIGAICSWGTPVSNGESAPIEDLISQFAGDVNNCPLGGFPDSCLLALGYFDNCIIGHPDILGSGLVPDTLLPSSAPCGDAGSVTVVCGAGDESIIDFGTGNGVGTPLPTTGGPSQSYATYVSGGTVDTAPGSAGGIGASAASATYPDAPNNCDELSAASAVALTQVVVTVGSLPSTLNAATYGWIA
jgi:hypothetical protein